MICTEFYDGQGLGNQLWLYVTTRTRAADMNVEFGIKNPEKFKGFEFLNLDFGIQVYGGHGPEGGPPEVLPDGIFYYYKEQQQFHPETGQDITNYDLDSIKVLDNTKVDGNFQGERFILHRKEEIRNWLRVKSNSKIIHLLDENMCIINFRGGEYRHMLNVFLPLSYWYSAREKMLQLNPMMKFLVVTDDPKFARSLFPRDEVIDQSMAEDYLAINQAKYLILSNSSFAWFPAWLNTNLIFCIAPKYWWGFNSNAYWSCAYNITSEWHYLDRSGEMFTYEQCIRELVDKDAPSLSSKSGEVYPLNVIDSLKKLSITNSRSPKDLERSPSSLSGTSLLFLIARETKSRVKHFVKSLFPTKFKVRYVSLNARIRRRLQFLQNEIPIIRSYLQYQNHANPVLEKYKVYDCFYFFNELDLLEIRLNILNDVVDHFIICESTVTFNGQQKNLIFQENKERFARFADKITHLVIEDSPLDRDQARKFLYSKNTSPMKRLIAQRSLTNPNVPREGNQNQWLTEFYQKESLHLALDQLADEDLVFISDLDEIWNPRARFKIATDQIYVFKQMPYMYFLNNRSNEHWHNWTGTIATQYRNVRNLSINDIRTHGRLRRKVVAKGGWHFSFQGGLKIVSEKIVAYGHQELNTAEITENLNSFIDHNKDLRGRKLKFRVSTRGLPDYILENGQNFQKLFRK